MAAVIRKFLKLRILLVSVVSKETSLPEKAGKIGEDTHADDIRRKEVRSIRRNIGVHDVCENIGDKGAKEQTDQGACRKKEQHRRDFLDRRGIRSNTDEQTPDIRNQEADQLGPEEYSNDQIQNGKHVATSTYLYHTIIPFTSSHVTKNPTLSLQMAI